MASHLPHHKPRGGEGRCKRKGLLSLSMLSSSFLADRYTPSAQGWGFVEDAPRSFLSCLLQGMAPFQLFLPFSRPHYAPFHLFVPSTYNATVCATSCHFPNAIWRRLITHLNQTRCIVWFPVPAPLRARSESSPRERRLPPHPNNRATDQGQGPFPDSK